MERIIGRFSGPKHGPLLIAFGAMHGNEPAGVKALEAIFEALEKEPSKNPNFRFNGRMLGLIGNMKAFEKKVRFIEKDLNRQWTVENVAKAKQNNMESLSPELQEMKAILNIIDTEIEAYQPSQIVILDLHTTTAFGGIFTLPAEDADSEKIALALHAPVIRGLLEGLSGTTLHYFVQENFDHKISAVTFESGQHNEPLSVNRAIAAITNCLRTVNCVLKDDVESKHDNILIEYSESLPKMSELMYVHPITPGDDFVMHPGFKNFQEVSKGQLLAKDTKGEILAKEDGRILMPLYQKQGEDGFFIIKTIEGFSFEVEMLHC